MSEAEVQQVQGSEASQGSQERIRTSGGREIQLDPQQQATLSEYRKPDQARVNRTNPHSTRTNKTEADVSRDPSLGTVEQ